MKKTAALLAAVVLATLLCACGAKAPEVTDLSRTATGRYRETEIPLPGGGVHMRRLFVRSDGTLDLLLESSDSGPFTQRGIEHHTLAPGGEWRQEETLWLDALAKEYPVEGEEDIASISMWIEEGTVWVSAMLGVPSDEHLSGVAPLKRGVHRWENGTLHDIGFKAPEAAGGSTMDLSAGGHFAITGVQNGQVMLASNGSTSYFVDENGGILGDYESNGSLSGGGTQLVGGRVVVSGSGKDGSVMVLSLPGLKREKDLPLPYGFPLCPDGDDAFLMITELATGEGGERSAERGVCRFLLDGSTEEILMRGTDYLFGAPGGVPEIMRTSPDGDIYIGVRSGALYKLYHYRYDPDMPLHAENTLTVFSMDDSPSVRQAVSVWNSQHPETDIEYVVGMESAIGAVTRDDIIGRLVTELVAGRGPDVLILDGLPAESLIEKGFLADLSGLVPVDALFENVAAAYLRGGMLYAVPTRMDVGLLGAQPDLLAQLASLEAVAAAAEAGPGSGTLEPNEKNPELGVAYASADVVFNVWYPAYGSRIWQGAEFDEALFARFLEGTGRIVAHNALPTVRALMREGGDEEENSGLYASWYLRDNSSTEYLNGGSRFFTTVPFGPMGLLNGFGTFNNQLEAHLAPLPGPDGEGVFVPVAAAALRTGGNAQGAEFIGVMLGASVQEANTGDGLPVRTASLQAGIQAAERVAGKITLQTDIMALVAALRPALLQEVPRQAALAAALDYYEGLATLEEAVEKARAGAALWMAEQG